MSRRYDHRIRNAIVQSGNQNLFPNLAIPKSTIRDWMKKGPANIVTTPELDLAPDELIMKINQLQQELIEVKAEKHLITKVFAVAGFQLQYKRIPNADSKTIIIDTIKQAAKSVGLDRCLETVQLSKSRFAAWVIRQKTCQLEDQKTCGRLSPTRLLNEEVTKIKQMVSDQAFRHYSITSLAIYAKREQLVYASISTWHRIIRQFKLDRPGKRVYPAKPKVGIRASAPGQIIHLDQSIIKLKDGTKCFIQAVICNFSRYVLAWQVSKNYGGCSTQQLLLSALEKLQSFGIGAVPEVFVDGGSENNNEHVEDMVSAGLIKKLIAQIEVDFSNSMIEALFYRLKHWHLFLQELSSFEKLSAHTDFYLTEANNKIPMLILGGATPVEVISGTWSDMDREKLKIEAVTARRNRIHTNLNLQCGLC